MPPHRLFVCMYTHSSSPLYFFNLSKECEYFANLPFLWHDTPYKEEETWSKLLIFVETLNDIWMNLYL